MKAIALTTITATCACAANVPQALQNLRNHTLLQTNKETISKLESIAHIATFDEIPIFGGQHYREERLEQLAQQP